MFLTLNTTELRIGDVVHNHGMLIKLDRPPILWERENRYNDGRKVVYSWPGLVLNPIEAVREYKIPYGWLYESHDHYDYDAGQWIRSTRPAWTVQGNDLAEWYVDREHVIGC